MDIAGIADYLTGRPQFNGRVGVSAALTHAYDVARALGSPSCVILGPRETVETNYTTAGVRQRVTATIGILIYVMYPGDGKTGKRWEMLDAVRNPTQADLVNWTPPGDDEPLEFAGAELAAADNSILLWLDRYTNRYRLPRP